jgi:hypothetical protein
MVAFPQCHTNPTQNTITIQDTGVWQNMEQ